MAKATKISRPKHLEDLEDNLSDVAAIYYIRIEVTEYPKWYSEMLNRAGVVLLLACWEAYTEDLATAGFHAMLIHSDSPNTFPPKVLNATAKALGSEELGVWRLAGNGWKEVLRQRQEAILMTHVGSLNTPSAKNVDSLFCDLLGIDCISKSWRWPAMTPAKARARLSALIKTRGDIAHRVRGGRPIHYRELDRAASFMRRLAVSSSNVVAEHVLRRTGQRPWGDFQVVRKSNTPRRMPPQADF